VSLYYDPLLAKLIVHARFPDRADLHSSRMLRAPWPSCASWAWRRARPVPPPRVMRSPTSGRATSRSGAPCRFYDRCGGCTLEHIEYDAQLAAKARIVADALRGSAASMAPYRRSSHHRPEFRYRNRVSFTLVACARAVVAGFHELNPAGPRARHRRRVPDAGAAVAEAWVRCARVGRGTHRGCRPAAPASDAARHGRGSDRAARQGGYGAGRPDELLRACRRWTPSGTSRAACGPVLLAGDAMLAEIVAGRDRLARRRGLPAGEPRRRGTARGARAGAGRRRVGPERRGRILRRGAARPAAGAGGCTCGGHRAGCARRGRGAARSAGRAVRRGPGRGRRCRQCCPRTSCCSIRRGPAWPPGR
jgi:hypothetical protein